jgi:hypothetical protein
VGEGADGGGVCDGVGVDGGCERAGDAIARIRWALKAELLETGKHSWVDGLVDAVRIALDDNLGGVFAFASEINSLPWSLDGIAEITTTNEFQIYFQQVGPGASPSTGIPVADLEKCARLFQLFGFDVSAAANFGSGIGVGFINIQGDDTAPYTYTMGRSSPSRFNAARIQFSALNLRVRPFSRRPM